MVVNNFVNKRYLIAIVLFFLIIILILGEIYIIDTKKSNPLTDYQNLKQKVEDAQKINSLANNHSFNVLAKNITDLQNSNLTKDKQLIQIKYTWTYLYNAYLETNNHELYNLAVEYKKFVNANYDNSFNPEIPCLDPNCAKQTTPQDLLLIINEINQSKVPDGIKNDYALQLKSFSYLNDAEVKALDFLSLADSIKEDEEFTKAGINLQIFNEIRNFVKQTYPEIFIKYSNKIFINKTQ